jgi:predicted transcriptional regulator
MPVDLSDKEKIVLNVVREYLDKNRCFNMNKILPFINSRFKTADININNEGIETILKSLIKKRLVIEGSKLTRDEILLNPKRNSIFKFIVDNPGVFFNIILKKLKLSYHVLVWHLEFLLKFNFIKKEVFENHELFLASNREFEQIKANFFNYKGKSKKIIDYLKRIDSGATKTQLSNDLKMHPNTITRYLSSLEQFNIVIKDGKTNQMLYFLDEKKT